MFLTALIQDIVAADCWDADAIVEKIYIDEGWLEHNEKAYFNQKAVGNGGVLSNAGMSLVNISLVSMAFRK